MRNDACCAEQRLIGSSLAQTSFSLCLCLCMVCGRADQTGILGEGERAGERKAEGNKRKAGEKREGDARCREREIHICCPSSSLIHRPCNTLFASSQFPASAFPLLVYHVTRRWKAGQQIPAPSPTDSQADVCPVSALLVCR